MRRIFVYHLIIIFYLTSAVIAKHSNLDSNKADAVLLTYENAQTFVRLYDGWNVVYTNHSVVNPEDVNFSQSVVLDADSIFYHNEDEEKENVWAYKYINIDSSIVNKSLSIGVYQSGTLQLFIEGKDALDYGYDKSGDLQNLHTVSFDSSGIYKFVVLFSDKNYRSHITAGMNTGFYMYVADPEVARADALNDQRFYLTYQMVFTTFIFSFALLHLVLFIYMPELKGNLYFLLFLVFYALNIYFDFQADLSEHVTELLISLRIHRAVMPFTTIFILRFLYSLFFDRVPRYYSLIVVFLLLAGGMAVYSPINNLAIINFATAASTLEIFRILIIANKKKADGARIITLGFGFLFIFSAYEILNDAGIIGSFGRLSNIYMFGAAGLIVCISIYLAKLFALSNRRLAEEEAQRLVLETDNKRKTWELEEARKLQLSLLPQCGDELLGYDVCFSMRTATEVGGDYYDYMITEDDTLTVVIGDATGHGMKAGNMVVLVKSLFNTMGHTFYIPDFFNHCTRQIKRMNFGNLFMSMSMIKLRRNNIVVSTAGMPPVLLYRKDKDEVEEILIKGMPLGAHEQFPYQEKNETINSGDVLLLMSDGIIELFNKSKQMFGIKRVKEILQSGHMLNPTELTRKLFDSCDSWRGKIQQNDDITLIILKRK